MYRLGMQRFTIFLSMLLIGALDAEALAPGDKPVEAQGYLPSVQLFTEGGDAKSAAFSVHRQLLGNANRRTGSQSMFHLQAVAEGSGANGEPNADFPFSVSIIKHNWLATGANAPNAGEMDGVPCNMRQGGPRSGPGAGQSDADCFVANIQSTKGSGYEAALEASVSDIDPADMSHLDHSIGVQAGVNNSRDGDYEGFVAASDHGASTAAFHASGSTNGSNFALFEKMTVACATTRGRSITYALQDVLTVSGIDGSATWKPCPTSAGAAVPGFTLKPTGGKLKILSDNGTPIASIDQNGNMTIKGTLTQRGSP